MARKQNSVLSIWLAVRDGEFRQLSERITNQWERTFEGAEPHDFQITEKTCFYDLARKVQCLVCQSLGTEKIQ
ncbi:hypothetical protein M2333_002592 [Sphingobium sp. B11D3B]|uniref:hypothetical protein n=1 Tax=Sphingobium sp. B11D3B TaxID=2940575 RepID=UPI002227F057|nr:hypothetical protein [Sphingobium sp. B11D3B]MCW2389546.1 hypothetical protein [Sphingobium sp. B11D3B]